MKVSSKKELENILEHIINKYCLDIDVSVEIANLKRLAGQYRHSERKIRISRYLMENYPEKVIDTVKHELGHAIADQRHGTDIKPHGEEWKNAMAEMNVTDPSPCHKMQLADYSYVVACTNPECDVEYGRYRRSKIVKQPELYTCGQCGGRLESFEVDS